MTQLISYSARNKDSKLVHHFFKKGYFIGYYNAVCACLVENIWEIWLIKQIPKPRDQTISIDPSDCPQPYSSITPADCILSIKFIFGWLNAKISQKMASGGLLFLALLLCT